MRLFHDIQLDIFDDNPLREGTWHVKRISLSISKIVSCQAERPFVQCSIFPLMRLTKCYPQHHQAPLKLRNRIVQKWWVCVSVKWTGNWKLTKSAASQMELTPEPHSNFAVSDVMQTATSHSTCLAADILRFASVRAHDEGLWRRLRDDRCRHT